MLALSLTTAAQAAISITIDKNAQRMTVAAGFEDPPAVFMADDLADMMRPDDDGADAHRSGAAPMRPVAREVIRRPRVAPTRRRISQPHHAAGRPRSRPRYDDRYDRPE